MKSSKHSAAWTALLLLATAYFLPVTPLPTRKRAAVSSTLTRTIHLHLPLVPIASASASASASATDADLLYSLMAEFPSPNRDTSASSGSSGPEYDPFVSDDYTAQMAVANTLYFSTIPHKRLVLRQENIREENGLSRHLLESIRPFHPFYVDY